MTGVEEQPNIINNKEQPKKKIGIKNKIKKIYEVLFNNKNRKNKIVIEDYIFAVNRLKEIPKDNNPVNTNLIRSYESVKTKCFNLLAREGLQVRELDALIARGLYVGDILKGLKSK